MGMVMAGTFESRSRRGSVLLTPGSFLLGNYGESYECGHDHAAGDRCVAFRYAVDYFERLAADAGAPRGERSFAVCRLPPLPAPARLVTRAATGVVGTLDGSWEELAVQVAGAAVRLARRFARRPPAAPPGGPRRVTRSVCASGPEPRPPPAPWTPAPAARPRSCPFLPTV